MSGLKSKYCVVVGRKRSQDVELRLRVSANMAKRLRQLAENTGDIRVSEVDFFEMLEPRPAAIFEDPELSTHLIGSNKILEELPFVPADNSLRYEATKPIENILREAESIIYGDRERAYGSPRFNLDTIAQLWAVYIDRKFPEHVQAEGGHSLTAEDVAQLMILLKTARLIHNPTHRDSLVDQAGYAALQNRIQDTP